jgi:CBS-domain-containing membrane protein
LDYFKKMKGSTQSPPRVGAGEVLWSWIGSFLGIAVVALLHYKIMDERGLAMIIGSFGASAVLVYGAIRSPLAQPRNLMGGHILSALVGVTAFRLFGGEPWLAAALAVSVAIALMHLTKTLHPPGGATALIAVIGSSTIHDLGYWYVLVPVGLGATIMLLIALLVNNIPGKRRYPEFWW